MTLAALARTVLARPRLALALVAAATLVLAAGLPRVRTEFGYRPLLGDAHPEIQRLEGFIDRFGGGLPVWVVWSCEAQAAAGPAPCVSALDARSLAMIDAVEQRLRRSPAVRDLASPASATLLVPEGDGFAIRTLVAGGRVAEDLDALAEHARESPLWLRRILSEDARTGALVVQPVDAESATSEALVDAIQEALAPARAAGFEFHLVGHAVEFVVAGRELARSTAVLTPVAIGVVAGVLQLLFGSAGVVLATLATLSLALVWTFGLLGWLGWPQDAVLQTLAPLVLVVGGCDAIHLVSRLAEGAGRTRSGVGRDAVRRAAREVARPCLVTSVTTAMAFASFATSELETFVRFGVIASFAVLACLLLSFSVLPLLLLRVALPARGAGVRGGGWQAVLEACVHTAIRRRRSVLAAALLVGVASALGFGLFLRVDTDGEEMYGAGSQVIRWLRHVESHLARGDTLEIALELPPDLPASDPALLAGVAELSERLEHDASLGRASSVLDPMRWLSNTLAGEPAPSPRAAANAELLEILGFQDPEGLERWLDFDRRHLRVSVEAAFQSAARRGPVLEAVRRAAQERLPAGVEVALTGPYAIGHAWVRDVQRTQLRSFAVAFAWIFLAVAWHMRSLYWAGIAMLPTLLPALVVLGAMGWLGLSLDVGRAMIGAVILGIGVDDTLHLLDRARTRMREGAAPAEAIRSAVIFVGRAVVTTSLALALGFLALMVSSWQTVSSFGFFVALGILLALLADLFVLPALVASTRR